MVRRNLDDARDFSRSVSRLTDLVSTANVGESDVFLVLDTTEIQADAQPKQTTLSGVVNSMSTLPVFARAVQASHKYGAFFDTSYQLNTSVSGVNIMQLNSVFFNDGVTLVSGSRMIVPVSGVYDVQFSAQLVKTLGGGGDVDIWVVQNNQNVPSSNTQVTLQGGNARVAAAWNYFVKANKGDNIQLAWHSSDVHVNIAAYSGLTNPTRPDIPSLIVTVNQIS
jgi:hypothetical protein